MGLFSTAKQVLNEVYFGYTSGIARVFEAFQDFRRKYVTDRKFFTYNIDADHDPDLKRLVSEIEREFGYYSFSLVIENTDKINMKTYTPLFRQVDPKKVVSVSKSGYKFKPEAKVCGIVIAYTGLLFNKNINDREAFSVLLHEIGHNFQSYLHKDMTSMSVVAETIHTINGLLDIIFNIPNIETNGSASYVLFYNNATAAQLSKVFNKITLQDKRTVYSYFNMLRGIIGTVKDFLDTKPIKYLYLPFYLVIRALTRIINLMSPIGLFSQSIGYVGERIADNFPSYYGFGRDMASGLIKIKDVKVNTGIDGVLANLPIVGHVYNIALLPGALLCSISDVHPDAPQRVLGVVNSLKTDLNDPRLSPKLKKEIQQQLDDIEKETREFYTKKSRITDTNFAANAVDKFIFYCIGEDLKYKTFDRVFSIEKNVNDRTYQLMDDGNPISNVDIK